MYLIPLNLGEGGQGWTLEEEDGGGRVARLDAVTGHGGSVKTRRLPHSEEAGVFVSQTAPIALPHRPVFHCRTDSFVEQHQCDPTLCGIFAPQCMSHF